MEKKVNCFDTKKEWGINDFDICTTYECLKMNFDTHAHTTYYTRYRSIYSPAFGIVFETSYTFNFEFIKDIGFHLINSTII
jgi:hypothetical protein